MQITQNTSKPTVRSTPPQAGPSTKSPSPEGSDPTPPPSGDSSVLGQALSAGATILNRAALTGAYYYGGGGTVGGAMQFGAVLNGTMGALDSGQKAYGVRSSYGDAALGATLGGAFGAANGALQGWSSVVLAQACGGGLGGALTAGALLGAGEVVVDLLTSKK